MIHIALLSFMFVMLGFHSPVLYASSDLERITESSCRQIGSLLGNLCFKIPFLAERMREKIERENIKKRNKKPEVRLAKAVYAIDLNLHYDKTVQVMHLRKFLLEVPDVPLRKIPTYFQEVEAMQKASRLSMSCLSYRGAKESLLLMINPFQDDFRRAVENGEKSSSFLLTEGTRRIYDAHQNFLDGNRVQLKDILLGKPDAILDPVYRSDIVKALKPKALLLLLDFLAMSGSIEEKAKLFAQIDNFVQRWQDYDVVKPDKHDIFYRGSCFWRGRAIVQDW